MKKYNLKLKSIKTEPDKYGNKLIIDKIGLYDENNKWIKCVKLNDELINTLLNNQIDVII